MTHSEILLADGTTYLGTITLVNAGTGHTNHVHKLAVSDPDVAANVAGVTDAAPAAGAKGIVVRQVEGASATGVSPLGGASGFFGWLSSIYKKLVDGVALLPGSLGQKTMANSLAVVVASNQSAVPVSISGAVRTDDAEVTATHFVAAVGATPALDVTGMSTVTVALADYTAPWAGSVTLEGSYDQATWFAMASYNHDGQAQVMTASGGYVSPAGGVRYVRANVTILAAGDVAVTLTASTAQKFVRVPNGSLVLGASTAAIGKLAANGGVVIGNVGLIAGTASIGNVGSVPAATGSVTSVSDTAASTTLLASNASRRAATVYNDSTVDLYLKLGTGASTTSFTTKLGPGGYYEIPDRYTGVVTGVWASDAAGAARITELV